MDDCEQELLISKCALRNYIMTWGRPPDVPHPPGESRFLPSGALKMEDSGSNISDTLQMYYTKFNRLRYLSHL